MTVIQSPSAPETATCFGQNQTGLTNTASRMSAVLRVVLVNLPRIVVICSENAMDQRSAGSYIICDNGSQSWCSGFKRWCKRRKIKPRFGAAGKHGGIAVVERSAGGSRVPVANGLASQRSRLAAIRQVLPTPCCQPFARVAFTGWRSRGGPMSRRGRLSRQWRSIAAHVY